MAYAALLFVFLPAHARIGGTEAVVPNRTAPTAELATAIPTLPMAVLYTPVQAEVREEYERDPLNQKVQTWLQYWDWVQTFYKGNLLSEGWTKFSEVTLDVVKSPQNRPTVAQRLNRVGKLIAMEWAKDSRVRKINTTDLRGWNEAMADARRQDDGSGRHLLSVLERMHKRIDEKLRRN